MKTIMKVKKLSPAEVRKRREAIEVTYSNAIEKAEKAKQAALKALQGKCPHTNSESGEGGSLDYWFDCKDCGKS